MTRSLTPELALALVRELSCDVVSAELRPAGDDYGEEPAGTLRVRDDGLEMALALGPQALPALVRHDAARALAAVSRPMDRR